MRGRHTRIVLALVVISLGVVAAMQLIHPPRVQADALPAVIDRKLVGTWEIVAGASHFDLTLAGDGQFYRTDNETSWAVGVWKSANGILTLTSKDGSKDEQDNIGRANPLTVLYVDEVAFVAKARHNAGEENERDYLATFHKVK